MAPVSKGAPPTLPLRTPSITTTEANFEDEPPPSYDSIAASTSSTSNDASWPTRDPRSSSMQSLLPSGPVTPVGGSSARTNRRKLLLIYIHGFMGNETSFRSFPAHVHNLLTVLLSDSHVVHSKIYPRYYSKRHIRFARDDFSSWLQPHEGIDTDVVLLGHSMGGLLSAEVAMMPITTASGYDSPFQHRILGTINFDVPFLGMHPGIIKSGLASVFNKPEEPKDQWYSSTAEEGQRIDSITTDEEYGATTTTSSADASRADSPSSMAHLGRSGQSSRTQSTLSDGLWTPEQEDPNFNPSFTNDVVRPIRTGWRNALHFVSKHPHELLKASRKLVQSHLEFGGAMANYGELKARYLKIRGLEVEDERVRTGVLMRSLSNVDQRRTPRVRFVNYYTVCTGRPKPAASESEAVVEQEQMAPHGEHEDEVLSERASMESDRVAKSSSESLLTEATLDTTNYAETLVDEGLDEAAESLTIGDSASANPTATSNATMHLESLDSGLALDGEPSQNAQTPSSSPANLPALPPLPAHPAPLDVSYIQDPATRKLVEKEHERAVRSYERAVRDRDRILRDRAKMEAKQQRKASKSAEKVQRKDEKTQRSTSENKDTPDDAGDDEKVALKETRDEEKRRRKQAKDEDKARRKEAHDSAKMEAKERKLQEKEMTHQQKEELRLEKERQRMEAESRRLRGEKSPSKSIEDSAEKSPAVEKDGTGDYFENNITTRPAVQDSLLPTPLSSEPTMHSTPVAEQDSSEFKAPPKERTFCILPPKDSSGQRDPCWIRVFMKDVDEVGAHCGLFFVDERYERLVGETAERIEGWVREDQSLRKISDEKSWPL